MIGGGVRPIVGSVLDVVGVCREPCWRNEWVIDFDLGSLFDSAVSAVDYYELGVWVASEFPDVFFERFRGRGVVRSQSEYRAVCVLGAIAEWTGLELRPTGETVRIVSCGDLNRKSRYEYERLDFFGCVAGARRVNDGFCDGSRRRRRERVGRGGGWAGRGSRWVDVDRRGVV